MGALVGSESVVDEGASVVVVDWSVGFAVVDVVCVAP